MVKGHFDKIKIRIELGIIKAISELDVLRIEETL